MRATRPADTRLISRVVGRDVRVLLRPRPEERVDLGLSNLQPELAQQYAEVDRRIEHRFRLGLSMAEIIACAADTPALNITTWAA